MQFETRQGQNILIFYPIKFNLDMKQQKFLRQLEVFK